MTEWWEELEPEHRAVLWLHIVDEVALGEIASDLLLSVLEIRDLRDDAISRFRSRCGIPDGANARSLLREALLHALPPEEVPDGLLDAVRERVARYLDER